MVGLTRRATAGRPFGISRHAQPDRITENIPLTISRIGHSRGRPMARGSGKCGAITRHSASVRSVWYRMSAAMLPSSGRRPHDESQVGSRNPLESRRVR